MDQEIATLKLNINQLAGTAEKEYRALSSNLKVDPDYAGNNVLQKADAERLRNARQQVELKKQAYDLADQQPVWALVNIWLKGVRGLTLMRPGAALMAVLISQPTGTNSLLSGWIMRLTRMVLFW